MGSSRLPVKVVAWEPQPPREDGTVPPAKEVVLWVQPLTMASKRLMVKEGLFTELDQIRDRNEELRQLALRAVKDPSVLEGLDQKLLDFQVDQDFWYLKAFAALMSVSDPSRDMKGWLAWLERVIQPDEIASIVEAVSVLFGAKRTSEAQTDGEASPNVGSPSPTR
jgi:hypothetical protein